MTVGLQIQPEVFGEDDGVVSPISRSNRLVVDNILESAG